MSEDTREGGRRERNQQ